MEQSMRFESVGVVDLRRNLSALLETTRTRPLMVHRYGTPWACVVSDEQWQQHRVQLMFDPWKHPLSRLRSLQRQHLALPDMGDVAPAAAARALILHAVHAFDDIAELCEQVRYDRMLHWFVSGDVAMSERCDTTRLRDAIGTLMRDGTRIRSLSGFLSRHDVIAAMAACGATPQDGDEPFRMMTAG